MFNLHKQNTEINLNNALIYSANWLKENDATFSLVEQAQKNVEYLTSNISRKFENYEKISGVSIISSLYHTNPIKSDEIYAEFNDLFQNLCDSIEKNLENDSLTKFDKFINNYEVYTFITPGLNRKIKIPSNYKNFIFLAGPILQKSDNIGLVNFSMLLEGLHSAGHESTTITEFATLLSKYPETASSAFFYFLNAKDSQANATSIFFDLYVKTPNIHVAALCCHFMGFHLDRLTSEQAKYLLLSAAEKLSILAQYKMSEYIAGYDFSKVLDQKLNEDDYEKILDLFGILLSDGPSNGIFPTTFTKSLIKLLVDHSNFKFKNPDLNPRNTLINNLTTFLNIEESKM